MHGEEIAYVKEAYDTNWMSTVGKNINELEKIAASKSGVKYAVALSSGTAALHLCIRLAAERLYGKSSAGIGKLLNRKVFCSDCTFTATINPILYEGGIPIFIDTEADSWGMDPIALDKAFEMYPEVKLVVCAELYGFPGNMSLIKEICKKHGALLIEDAAEALGASWDGIPCGSFGDYAAISFNGNKIITGSSGGCFLTDNLDDANKVRKLSTQAREDAPWYQHEETGFNYRISNVIAGVVRGQYLYLEKHIEQKKNIYNRYRDKLHDLPLIMNPFDEEKCIPNYWLSSVIINKDAMCKQVRSDNEAIYIPEHGKSCPTEILEKIARLNAEGRPIWKPMHMQPIYRMNEFITANGSGRARTNAYIEGTTEDIGADIFRRGLCLPSDNKMTTEQQDRIIEVIRKCFE